VADVVDRDARFERICEAHMAAVLAYALRRTSREDAADVVAETFLFAWRRLDEVDEQTALPWLYAIARRVLSGQRRSALRQRAIAERLASLRADPVYHTPAASPRLREALAGLPEGEREVLMLAAWEELPGRDAAAVLGCSPTAYRIRLHRARRRLRERLERAGHSPAVSTRTEESTSC
jgi:RNA polymerase sigma-70 factor, ECF subfamily